ncbi:MAG TPA: beta-1,6-N-acetylglucosaminyltransferase [Candidatus Dependentiae bacterium]|nr:beta-1,6-N-acetylglucosaminyltransferase [Candidatus Dependentiae bacterium]HRQ62637.1 beta-1,6-N-acetylglucosaminyltransferase [Candidatus Dependentiae bacterium]
MKIALLFLTIANIYHEPYWKQFLQGNESNYSIYIHAKEGISADSFFKPYELPSTVPTTWANTMKAQILLLKQALQDPLNEKFIFLSESTLPLRSFQQIYSIIMATDTSIFNYVPNPHQHIQNHLYNRRSLKDIPAEFRYKCSQWVILNRKHAGKIINDSYYIDLITRYEADNELYPATFLASQGLLSEVTKVDKTYVNWQKHNPPGSGNSIPFMFTNLHEPDQLICITKAISQGYLFARKFSKDANLIPLHSYLPYMNSK